LTEYVQAKIPRIKVIKPEGTYLVWLDCRDLKMDSMELRRFMREEARGRIENPVGRELMRQRKTRIEGIFALGKELHGLRRTRLMGRWKVQIQLWLTATVINLKRAVKELTNRLDGVELSNQRGSSSFPIAITTATRILVSLTAN
jgi:hypothetical protein